MNNVAANVEAQFKALASQFLTLQQQAANIYKAYNATDVVTLVSALASSTTPATVSTSLNKYQYQAGITLCAQLVNFFNNQAVSSADYYATSENLVNGDTTASSPLSTAVEAIGSQLQQLGQNALNYYAQAVVANAAYNQNGLAQCISAISSGQIMPGSSSTAAAFTAAITMVLQFINLMTNQSVSAGNYLNTAIMWTQD